MGRSDDVSLVVGENGLTECLADVASFGVAIAMMRRRSRGDMTGV